ncbi:hypothetical protein GDO81_003177 [Engystomops pustulosus]|uniref:Uncharacterized protein n=1 Tax=Engystomops pustulosus TaxID=76066 RepID=A0AAV6ZVA2_ENGPU|nr:hypothetical protein GDO81_003177 [Engystomops pustulosus]
MRCNRCHIAELLDYHSRTVDRPYTHMNGRYLYSIKPLAVQSRSGGCSILAGDTVHCLPSCLIHWIFSVEQKKVNPSIDLN